MILVLFLLISTQTYSFSVFWRTIVSRDEVPAWQSPTHDQNGNILIQASLVFTFVLKRLRHVFVTQELRTRNVEQVTFTAINAVTWYMYQQTLQVTLCYSIVITSYHNTHNSSHINHPQIMIVPSTSRTWFTLFCYSPSIIRLLGEFLFPSLNVLDIEIGKVQSIYGTLRYLGALFLCQQGSFQMECVHIQRNLLLSPDVRDGRNRQDASSSGRKMESWCSRQQTYCPQPSRSCLQAWFLASGICIEFQLSNR